MTIRPLRSSRGFRQPQGPAVHSSAFRFRRPRRIYRWAMFSGSAPYIHAALALPLLVWGIVQVNAAETKGYKVEERLSNAEHRVDLSPLQRLLAKDPESAKPLAVKVYESGYINTALRTSRRGVFWLDNERVMFEGYSRTPRVRAQEATNTNIEKNDEQLYIWNYKTGATKQYAKNARNVCYHNGQIRYVVAPVDEKPYVVRGPLGKEKKELLPPPVTDGRIGIEYVRCEGSQEIYEEFARRTGIKHHHLLVLLEEHGVIDRGPSIRLIGQLGDPQFQVKLYPPQSKQGIDLYRVENGRKLPVRYMHFQNDVHGYGNYYYPFANVYLFHSAVREESPHTYGNWPKGLPYPVRIFRPSGETETMKLPYISWGAPVAVALTRKGIYMAGYSVLRDGAIDDRSGGFIVASNGTVTQLVQGITKSLEVSPDGCKVAFSLLPKNSEKLWAYEMKVVQLCEGAGK